MAILKTATIAEAHEALAQGSFVYNNPCCQCGKQCSTPTKQIWMRRIQEFGGIEQMYQQYRCRRCRKVEPLATIAPEPLQMTAPEPAHNAAPDPLQQQPAPEPAPMQPVKRMPMPGDPVKAMPGCVGMSVWETNHAGNMEFRGTNWIQIHKK